MKCPANLSLYTWRTKTTAEINITKQESKQERVNFLITNVCTNLVTERFVIIMISLLIYFLCHILQFLNILPSNVSRTQE